LRPARGEEYAAAMSELDRLDALAQADLVRKGEVRPTELLERAIVRLERVNRELNAVVTPMFDLAREAARGELPDGPFCGVPFLLKDLLTAYAGVPLSNGAVVSQGLVPDHDSELVRRHKRAGLVVFGKTNTPEFGIPPMTENRLFGATRNPWDPTRSPGGSSGGAAAMVAARVVPMAHGGDGGGSIRIPASCCGVFGLKPTRARNPLGPDYGDLLSGLVVEHALSLTVRDSAALLDATSGPAAGDPYWAPPPARPFLQEVGRPPGRLRIAFTREAPNGVTVHPDCVAALEDAARLASSLGHDVEERAPSLDFMSALRAFTVLYAASAARTVGDVETFAGMSVPREMFEPLTWGLAEMGKKIDAGEYLLALREIQRVSRDLARFFETADVWLTPTLAEPPVPIGTFDATDEAPLLGFVRAGEFAPFTPLLNATGQPAMSVPLFWSAVGLPIGTQFVARFGDEATLFRLAAQLEEARPWRDRRPPIAAV
jgi:amidase